MSTAKPLLYGDRCERYARQRGWKYDPHAMSVHHLTPRQRRRAIAKERRAWPGYSRRAVDMPWHPREVPEPVPVGGWPDHGDFEYGDD